MPDIAGGGLSSAARCASEFFPSLKKGAGRAWGLACILVFLFFCLAGPALAVPPGTIIANTAQATFRSWVPGGMRLASPAPRRS